MSKGAVKIEVNQKKQYNPKTIKNFISGAKNELMNPKEYAKYSKGPFGEVVIRTYTQ